MQQHGRRGIGRAASFAGDVEHGRSKGDQVGQGYLRAFCIICRAVLWTFAVLGVASVGELLIFLTKSAKVRLSVELSADRYVSVNNTP